MIQIYLDLSHSYMMNILGQNWFAFGEAFTMAFTNWDPDQVRGQTQLDFMGVMVTKQLLNLTLQHPEMTSW